MCQCDQPATWPLFLLFPQEPESQCYSFRFENVPPWVVLSANAGEKPTAELGKCVKAVGQN